MFTSAASAIKGHDSCHCVAVPERKGTTFIQPPHYKAWNDEYARVTKQLTDAGEPVNLPTVIKAMGWLREVGIE